MGRNKLAGIRDFREGPLDNPLPVSLPSPPRLGSVSQRWEGAPWVPGGKGPSWAPWLNFPIPPVPPLRGAGSSPLLPQYCQPQGPRTRPPPPWRPIQVGGGEGVDGASAKEADVGP